MLILLNTGMAIAGAEEQHEKARLEEERNDVKRREENEKQIKEIAAAKELDDESKEVKRMKINEIVKELFERGLKTNDMSEKDEYVRRLAKARIDKIHPTDEEKNEKRMEEERRMEKKEAERRKKEEQGRREKREKEKEEERRAEKKREENKRQHTEDARRKTSMPAIQMPATGIVVFMVCGFTVIIGFKWTRNTKKTCSRTQRNIFEPSLSARESGRNRLFSSRSSAGSEACETRDISEVDSFPASSATTVAVPAKTKAVEANTENRKPEAGNFTDVDPSNILMNGPATTRNREQPRKIFNPRTGKDKET